jgi:hypothetical protein
MKRILLILAVAAACGKTKPAAPQASATKSDAAAPRAAIDAAPIVDAAPPVAIAAPAPTFCDGKPCPCKAGTSTDAKDEWKQCELEKPLVVQGVPCGAGDLRFHADGKLKECSLEAPVDVGPYHCQVGVGILWLHPDGKLKRCNVAGTAKVGDFDLEDKRFGYWDLEIYDDGGLKDGTLAAPRTIGGKPCRRQVTLYRGGAPYSCDLDAPLTEGTLTLPEATPVMWSKDGKVIGYFPQEDMPYKGGVHKAGEPVCLVKNCNEEPD